MNRQMLFIAGAPRSGTTLLCNLLDGLDGMLVFPTEHATLEQFHWNNANKESYFRSEFLSNRREGQQVILSNRDVHDEKLAAMSSEFGKKFELEVDTKKFRSAYLEELGEQNATRKNVLIALSRALSESNEYAAASYPTAKWLCFKQPFFTELFAADVATEIEDCKFLQIIRNPQARYCSAKARRMRQKAATSSKLGPINRLSYVEGHSFFDVASRRLAKQNLQAIGRDRYKTIQFEQLVESPQKVLAEILSWLSLEEVSSVGCIPTRLGQPSDSRSSHEGAIKVDSAATERAIRYAELTSWNERLIHAALLELLLNGVRTKTSPSLLAAYLVPLPNSSFKNYVCQLLGLWRWLTNNYESTFKAFMKTARDGKAAISGAT